MPFGSRHFGSKPFGPRHFGSKPFGSTHLGPNLGSKHFASRHLSPNSKGHLLITKGSVVSGGLFQEVFDATARLTLSVRRISLDLIKHVGNSQDSVAARMRDRGVQVCKELVEPTEKMESLLARMASENSEDEVKAALKLSVNHFQPLKEFMGELEAMCKFLVGKKPKLDVK